MIELKRSTLVIGGVVIAVGLMGLGYALISGGAKVGERANAPSPAAPETKAGSAEQTAGREAPAKEAATNYGDWSLRCQQTGTAQQRDGCEIFQNVMLQNQSAPFAQFAFGKPAQEGTLHLTVVVPINISFPSTVRVALDEKDPQPIQLDWTRCLPAGCFATAVVKDAALKKWRAAAAPGRVSFNSSSEQQVVMPISFRGLGQALDALGKEP